MQLMYSYFSRCYVTTNSVALSPPYKPHTTGHNSSIRSDEGLTLETPAFRFPVRWSINIIYSVDKIKFHLKQPSWSEPACIKN